ncbi:hypothetical protein EON64_11125, partial [archaeon]
MTRQNFLGAVELREQLKDLAHKSRVERIKEVRLQERRIAHERCQQFRDKVQEHKQMKVQKIKNQKMQELEKEHCRKFIELESALVHTGEAHRAARLKVTESITEQQKRIKAMETRRTQAAARMKDALKKIRDHRALQDLEEHERDKLIDIKADLRLLEREDARAYQEHLEALRQIQSQSNPETNDFSLIPRSAERVHHRFPHKVYARVLHHTPTSPDTIINDAAHQEEITSKVKWAQIMEEMTRKQRVKERAREALLTTVKLKSARGLVDDLLLLEQIDKLPSRLHRVKEASMVQCEENREAMKGFEKTFMVSRNLPLPPSPG